MTVSKKNGQELESETTVLLNFVYNKINIEAVANHSYYANFILSEQRG